MLSELHINHFALIDQHTISFLPGMTVLTGETGAGKSIIIDALSLALGERADSTCIRTGFERCEITARFELELTSGALAWLTEHDLNEQQDCVLRRIISKDGKSRAYINGQGATLPQLRALSEFLVDIHGQHEHQSLLKRSTQRTLIDQYGAHQHLLDELKQHYQAWSFTKQQLQQLHGLQAQQDRAEFIQFQLNEWQTLAVKTDDIAALEQEHKHLATRGDTLAKVQTALTLLSTEETPSLSHTLHQARSALQSIKDTHASVNNAFTLIDSASIQLNEAGNDLQHYLAAAELNPERLVEVENLLHVIYQLARKHRVKPLELEGFFNHLHTELAQLSSSAETIFELEQQLNREAHAYNLSAEKLKKARTTTGAKLSLAISEKMQLLGMSGGRFEIHLEALNSTEPNLNGSEHIDFMVSTNPGQALQTLSKVASGGELSRISLAIQVILAGISTTPTLVFDEVDVGIGGPTAAIVGQLLRTLSHSVQILCVTHLPQVAACGTQHYQIIKHTTFDQTTTAIYPLHTTDREQEIARMLGGLTITEQSLAHARELLHQSEK